MKIKPAAFMAILGITFLLIVLLTLIAPRQGAYNEPENVTFLVKPYLQLGDAPKLNDKESLELLWETPDNSTRWTIEVKLPTDNIWHLNSGLLRAKTVRLPGLMARRMYDFTITELIPGKQFEYRLRKDGTQVFASRAVARKSKNQEYRFAVFGDLAAGGLAPMKVAYEVYKASPDMVMLTGDIVYTYGRFREYLEKFFPVYNADIPSPGSGAPLLRSVLFAAAPGNHDIGTTRMWPVHDLGRFPDGLAYFTLWNQPLNGPFDKVDGPDIPVLYGPDVNKQTFLEGSGSRFPRMANFSFDYGNAHWTVLDANDYMDWNDARLRDWLERDLASAKDATWRFVAYHQAAFSSDKKHHFSEQRMRLIDDILQKYKVDIVFAGHVHNYQRTLPLVYSVEKQAGQSVMMTSGAVPGSLIVDKSFDGNVHIQPHGIIYVISGGGGAALSGAQLESSPASWQPYTAKFIAGTHSFTVCDVKDRTLTLRQISEDGTQLDRITISKP